MHGKTPIEFKTLRRHLVWPARLATPQPLTGGAGSVT